MSCTQTRLVRLANCTSHWQTQNIEAYAALGFDVRPEPLLPHVQSGIEAIRTAEEAVAEALRLGMDGVLVAGRTDLAVYVALIAVDAGLDVYVPDTDHSFTVPPGLPGVRHKLRLRGVARIAVRRSEDGIMLDKEMAR